MASDFDRRETTAELSAKALKRLRKEQEIKQDTLSTDKINTEQQMPEAQSKRKREQK